MHEIRQRLSAWIAPSDAEDDQTVGLTGRSNWLGTLGDLIAVGTVLYVAVNAAFGGKANAAILASALALIAIVFMVWNILLQRSFQRETARTRAATHLVQTHTKLRDASAALLNEELDDYTVHVAEAARELSRYFTAATFNTCRVAIQLVSNPTGGAIDGAYVRPLCRSDQPEHDQRSQARLREPALVGRNTDFFDILTGKRRVFFSNDIYRVRNYENSHFDVTVDPKKYPYRSTIVWPIQGPAVRRSPVSGVDESQGSEGAAGDDKSEDEGVDIVGFLSVDARAAGAFTRALDVPTGKFVSAALHSSLSGYMEARLASVASREGGGPKPSGSEES